MASTGAERSRALRKRRRQGAIVCPIEVDRRIRETMIDVGWLNPEHGDCREAVAAAAAELLRQWELRWRDEIIPQRVTFGRDRLR